MKGKQTALMPGNEDKVGYWLTPWEDPQFRAIADEFGFDPPQWKRAFDPVPFPRPDGWDGLKEPWPDRSAWVNPPFVGANLAAWARKCIEENRKGKLVVMIGPAYRWIGTLIQAGAEVRSVNVRWMNPRGRAEPGGGSPELILILRPKPAEIEATPHHDGEQRPTNRGGV